MKQLSKSIAFSFLTIFFSFLAVFISFLDEAFAGTFNIFELLNKGEVIIICISLVINSIYILYNHDKKGKTFPHFAFWLSLILYTISFAVYILITNNQYPNLDYIIFTYSIILTIIIFVLTVYTHYIQNLSPEVSQRRDKDKQDLSTKFDNIRNS